MESTIEGRRRPILDRIEKARAAIIDRAVAKGCDRAQATETLTNLEAERPLLDWLLIGGGLEKIIELIVFLLSQVAGNSVPAPGDGDLLSLRNTTNFERVGGDE